MKKEPLLSIITVVRNGEKHIEETIQNVLSLSYPNIHYIIIDGSSTDGTVDIIRKYQDSIHYWISEPDRGIYDAMNKGWKVASEDSLILFLGAGDKVLHLPDLTNIQKNTITYGNIRFSDSKYFYSRVGYKLFLGNTLHHQALLVPKNLHPEPPFDLKFKVYADFDFNQRLLKTKSKFKADPKFESFVLVGGLSANFNTLEMQSVVKKNFGIFVSYLSRMYYRFQRIKNKFSHG